jgi:hypothetical protein
MRRSRVLSSSAAVLGLLAASGTVALAPGAQAAPAGAAAPAAAPLTRSVTVGAAGPRDALLPTGERVVLRPGTAAGARQSVSVDGRGTSARSVQVVRLADRLYAVPDIAKPYLGRILGLGLFDASTATSAAGRVRVSIGYSGAVPRVPGVTLTRSGGGHADGYLTASSARTFGAALARTYAADAKAHWPRRTTLFGARTISAVSRPAEVARPAFVMRTLIVKGVDVAGKPVPFGFVVLVNVEDGRRYANAVVLIDGEARVSVPDGTYAAFGDLSTGGTELLDAVENIQVQGPGQTLMLDARRATSTLRVSSPRPAKVSTQSFDWVREDAGGYLTVDFGFFVFGSAPVKVSPAAAPALGTLVSQSGFSLTGTAKSSLPYTYDAVYPAVGIPAQQSHTLSTRELATLDSRYAGDDGSKMTAGVIHLGLSDLIGGASGGTAVDLRLPARRLEYLRVAPGIHWATSLFADNGAPAPIFVDGGLHNERAGTTRVETWLQGPIALRIPTSTAAEIATGFAGCPVCRDRDDLLAIVALGDTTPDHVVAFFSDPSGKPVARFRVYKDGVLLADQPDTLGAALTVPPSSGRYRLLVSLDRRVNRPHLSTASTLDVTFVSSAATGAALPAAVGCGLPGPCRVPAVLQASVALPVDTAGSVHAGVHHVVLTLGHQQFATGARVTSGFVQVRIGKGRWIGLPVRALGHGRFDATLRTTKAQARSFVDLRVGGKDAGGGSLTQTTSRAFVLSR